MRAVAGGGAVRPCRKQMGVLVWTSPPRESGYEKSLPKAARAQGTLTTGPGPARLGGGDMKSGPAKGVRVMLTCQSPALQRQRTLGGAGTGA